MENSEIGINPNGESSNVTEVAINYIINLDSHPQREFDVKEIVNLIKPITPKII